MATIKDTSALKALNEQDYINKLYDKAGSSQKELLQQNYTDNMGLLDQEQQNTQKQTDQYVNRTAVENRQAAKLYGTGRKTSAGANAQAALTQGNARQANVTALNKQQNQAVTEIDRQRSLAGQRVAAEIQQAQADNDMERAQALYEAAKTEDQQYLALRKQAATLMAGKGDNSVTESLAGDVTAPTGGETWAGVLKNEDAINKIYDAQLESERLGLQMENAEALSDLEARRRQSVAQTDESLNDAYVDGLKKAKNFAEVQNAYGMGSGTFVQSQLARDAETQDTMTELRRLGLAADADYGMEGYDLAKAYRDSVAKATRSANLKRAQALFDAAESEEQTLLDKQQFLGNQYAKNNDYSVLGKLYGLTQDQIDRLQGTGAYAPKYESASSRGSGGTTLNRALSAYYGTTTETGNDKPMTQAQVNNLYDRLKTAAKQDQTAKQAQAERAFVVAGNKTAARTGRK